MLDRMVALVVGLMSDYRQFELHAPENSGPSQSTKARPVGEGGVRFCGRVSRMVVRGTPG
jgi:hypothetical protein